ncbi:GTP pyrophosphokinase family protein [Ornithinibacillus sp. 4-3]|uniref:GTP pyrophosphokinase family protein n=1 Tax=Ornithinibacillus sp. 4-3 TaxID=3231488 RepID=A0AB39HUE7_9BACI
MEQNMTLNLNKIKAIKIESSRFMMPYKFALDEINTKINILKEEFTYLHDYNPIEHVTSRVKSVESIVKKISRKDLDISLDAIKNEIRDIAGVRITCSFISDIYRIKEMLINQKDIKLIECKDYIKDPKPNGYRSLHLLVEIPIFLSDREVLTPVEIQVRTIAMDFWASLEHKIFYKYNKDIPQTLIDELKEAAESAAELDVKMEHLNREIKKFKVQDSPLENSITEQILHPLQLLEHAVKSEEFDE